MPFFFFGFKDEHTVKVVFKIIIVDNCDHRYNLIGCMCNLPLEKNWVTTNLCDYIDLSKLNNEVMVKRE